MGAPLPTRDSFSIEPRADRVRNAAPAVPSPSHLFGEGSTDLIPSVIKEEQEEKLDLLLKGMRN